jgi:hypothetical protein
MTSCHYFSCYPIWAKTHSLHGTRMGVCYLKRFLDYEKKRSDLEPDESES